MLLMSAAAVVALAGVYLLSLAVATFVAPQRAVRFFGGFASSPRVHYLELGVRILVGIALLAYAPHMAFASAIRVFGWILVVSSLILAVVPWRWHQRFAQKTVPYATRFPRLLAAGSFVLGFAILGALARGS